MTFYCPIILSSTIYPLFPHVNVVLFYPCLDFYRHLTYVDSVFFFLNDPAPPEIYPLPLHDALPISEPVPLGPALEEHGHLVIGEAPAVGQRLETRELLPAGRVVRAGGDHAVDGVHATGRQKQIGRAHV